MDKVSIYDLTVEQIETIELAVGLPISQWSSAPSQAALYAQVMAVATGRDVAEFKRQPIKDLLAAVSIEGSDPNP
jgi:hypothetical protein